MASDKQTSGQPQEDESDFIVINEYIKLDLKNNVLLSNDKIDSGTRILIELPLFKIGRPAQTSHPANSLFLYHSFINNVKKELQKEILYNKYPLKKLNKHIAEHTENLQKLIKKTNKLNNKSVVRYTKKQWKEIEILQNIFHSYSLSLQLLSDPYQVVYDHYNNIRFNSDDVGDSEQDDDDNDGGQEEKQTNKRKSTGFVPLNDDHKTGKASTNLHDDSNHIIHLGKALYERASHLLHACNPCCRVNVIDEKGTIEIRTLVDIPEANIPLTRNFLDDTRGLGICKGDDDEFTRVLMNDDINLIPCNLRCKEILSNYHFVCNCPKCIDWDKTRGLLCCNASNSNGCKGGLWSRPPYLLWQCQSCHRLVEKENLFRVLEFEKSAINRLKGIEDIINYNFSRNIDVSSLLYPLLNDCSLYLASNHWIIIRLLWICFEEKLSRNYLPHSLIYLKRHIEACEQINDYDHNPSVVMANKYELIADLLPYDEIYKQEAVKKAIKMRQSLNGEQHASVKRCKHKLKFYQRKHQQT